LKVAVYFMGCIADSARMAAHQVFKPDITDSGSDGMDSLMSATLAMLGAPPSNLSLACFGLGEVPHYFPEILSKISPGSPE
jgi:hypothetical protein